MTTTESDVQRATDQVLLRQLREYLVRLSRTPHWFYEGRRAEIAADADAWLRAFDRTMKLDNEQPTTHNGQRTKQ